MILLNRFKVPGYNQKVSASLSIAGEDLSGSGSSTAQAETGEKAKEISVSTYIRFIDAKDLTKLIAVAESKSASDERVIYDIINLTANSMNIRQVQFQGDVQVHEEDNRQLWAITFKLVEYNSVPEKKQKQSDVAKAKVVKAQAATGKTVVVPAAKQSPTVVEAAKQPTASTPSDELSSAEKVLKYLDDKLK